MPDIINFEAMKDQRDFAEIDEDQAEWETVRDRLAEAMSDNALSDLALTSATLNALLQNITTAADIPLDEVKALIARCLKAYRD